MLLWPPVLLQTGIYGRSCPCRAPAKAACKRRNKVTKTNLRATFIYGLFFKARPRPRSRSSRREEALIGSGSIVSDLMRASSRRQGELPIEKTYSLLKNNLDVRQSRSTTLFEIAVRSTDPDEAAMIANAVAEEYCRYRLIERQEKRIQSMTTLTNELQKQEQKITDLEAQSRAGKDVQDDLEELQQSRYHLKMSIIQEKIESMAGHNYPVQIVVEIVDRAEPALKPIFPNKTKMAVCFVLGSLLIGIGVMGMKKSRPTLQPGELATSV